MKIMKRRIFVSGLLLACGALAGHTLTKGMSGGIASAMTPAEFAAATAGVKLQYLSDELLLKVFSRTVSDRDRQQLVTELVNHNRELFVVQAYNRQHGAPGFYRLTE
jgi:hypothetical protein